MTTSTRPWRNAEHDTMIAEFHDLVQPDVLAALGFTRTRQDRKVVYQLDGHDDSLVFDEPVVTQAVGYARPLVTVTLIGGWHPRIRHSFIWTNTPEHGPAYREQATHTRNTNTKEIIK